MSMIERMLQEEIRDKKRTGNGIHSRTGTRGYTGKIMFATDLMTARQRRHYTKGGTIVSWNMKEVLTKADFDTYAKEQQCEMLKAWRINFSNKAIAEKMGISTAFYYKLLEAVGVPRDRRTGGNRGSKSVALPAAPKVIELVEKKPTIETTTAPIFTEGLNFNINGSYSAEALSVWLTKLQMLTEGTGNYDVVIHLREKK